MEVERWGEMPGRPAVSGLPRLDRFHTTGILLQSPGSELRAVARVQADTLTGGHRNEMVYM